MFHSHHRQRVDDAFAPHPLLTAWDVGRHAAIIYDKSSLSFPRRVLGARSQGKPRRIEGWLCHSPAVGTRMSYCFSLCLYFHICEIIFWVSDTNPWERRGIWRCSPWSVLMFGLRSCFWHKAPKFLGISWVTVVSFVLVKWLSMGSWMGAGHQKNQSMNKSSEILALLPIFQRGNKGWKWS